MCLILNIGSTRNRYTKPDDWQVNRTGQAKVLLDTNFILDNKSKPMALKNVYYKILMIWINNDSLFFSRSNIVDYSLLVIIDNEKKTVRFGIIDYIQQYDGKKMIESKFKAIIAAGDIPTIGKLAYLDAFLHHPNYCCLESFINLIIYFCLSMQSPFENSKTLT